MLCEIAEKWASGSFVLTWVALCLIALTSILLSSGTVFYFYYWPSQVTYEKWTRKSNPRFPSPEKVRDEIVQMLKGMSSAALCPAASLWLAARGKNQAYCGLEGSTPASSGWGYIVGTFLLTMIVSDFWSFFYHRLGHVYPLFWTQHKHHHVFFNPSPFAVIADEYLDQFLRATPLLVFPLLLPVNMDMLFFQYGLFFYAYGVYLHWGFEVDALSAHNPIINTAFQHYCHHAKSIIGKPYHCGFFFKCWDQLFGCTYDMPCFCAACACAKGGRSREAFAKLGAVPDYALLLSPKFWFRMETLTGTSAADTNAQLSVADRATTVQGARSSAGDGDVGEKKKVL